MTDERMALIEMLEKAADSYLVREMLAFAAERIKEAEAEMQTGPRRAHTTLRENHCNGYRERDWVTRVGRTKLAISKLRKGSYFPSSLGRRRTAEKALVAVIQEAYVHGVSTQAVDDLVHADQELPDRPAVAHAGDEHAHERRPGDPPGPVERGPALHVVNVLAPERVRQRRRSSLSPGSGSRPRNPNLYRRPAMAAH
jgi:hypothetical protein